MLLPLLVLAHAGGILDAGGIGAAGATNQDGELAGGVALAHLAGDLDAWVLFGEPAASGNPVRGWSLAIGRWTPTFITARDGTTKKDQNQQSDAGFPPLPEERKRRWLLGTPRLRVGGDTWRDERFRADMGGQGLLNLVELGRVDPSVAYGGFSFGGRTEVVYASSDHDAGATGALILDAGVAAGGTVAQVVVGRVRGGVEVDPFVGDLALNSGVLLAGSLAPADVPLALRLDGEAWTYPARAMATEWRAMLYALISSD